MRTNRANLPMSRARGDFAFAFCDPQLSGFFDAWVTICASDLPSNCVFPVLNETAPRQAEDGKVDWAGSISLHWGGCRQQVGEANWRFVFRFSISPFFPKELSR